MTDHEGKSPSFFAFLALFAVRICRRLRRWWHVTVRGIPAAAAEDLMDGIDLGDHACGFSAPPPLEAPEPKPRRRPAPNPPACPGLATQEETERCLKKAEADRAGRCSGLPTLEDLERIERERRRRA